jgi:cytochrome P450
MLFWYSSFLGVGDPYSANSREMEVTVQNPSDLYWDPYDIDLYADPYPTYRRMREEAPLYYNEVHDFYALSRFHDVERALGNPDTFLSSWGTTVEAIKANMKADFKAPNGVFIQEDPPLHTVHRGVLSRVFTPKKMNALEPQIREYCAKLLDPLVGGDTFNFVDDLGAKMPMHVIGMLLGIPEDDQETIRVQGDERIRREPGKPSDTSNYSQHDDPLFHEYLDWRATHPSDDLMTELLNVEFEDETGTLRRLTRGEIMTFVTVLAVAGNETTNRLIGWTGKVLGDHPDQRRDIVEDRSLIPYAIEEILRFETSGTGGVRALAHDTELYGQTVPAGSAVMLVKGSANRDHRAFPPDGDVFDIHRPYTRHVSFGHGIHHCLGSALARVEARVALDEVLNRFPDWEVDSEHAELETAIVRGWKTLPVRVR